MRRDKLFARTGGTRLNGREIDEGRAQSDVKVCKKSYMSNDKPCNNIPLKLLTLFYLFIIRNVNSLQSVIAH